MPNEAAPSKAMFWTGWVLSAVPIVFLGSGAFFALTHASFVMEGMGKYGFTPSFTTIVGMCELLCVLFYAIPRTAAFGAMLMTAYMGAAVITHLRAGESQWFVPIVFCVIVWAGLLLRRPSLRTAILGI
jgi:hypothetical protein